MPKEIRVAKVTNSGCSSDGERTWLSVEIDGHETQLTMSRDELRAIPILALTALANAENAATGGSFYSFKLREARIAEDRASQDILLLLRLLAGKNVEPQVAFQLPDQGLDQLKRDIEQIIERRKIPPHERRDH